MIKFSFLETLLDLSVSDAEKAVYLAGFEFCSIPQGMARAAITVPNTVFLEHKDGKVTSATVGDSFDLLDDSVTTE